MSCSVLCGGINSDVMGPYLLASYIYICQFHEDVCDTPPTHLTCTKQMDEADGQLLGLESVLLEFASGPSQQRTREIGVIIVN